MKRVIRRLSIHNDNISHESPRYKEAKYQIDGVEVTERQHYIYELNILRNRNQSTAKYAARMSLYDEERIEVENPIKIGPAVSDEELIERLVRARTEGHSNLQQELQGDQEVSERRQEREEEVAHIEHQEPACRLTRSTTQRSGQTRQHAEGRRRASTIAHQQQCRHQQPQKHQLEDKGEGEGELMLKESQARQAPMARLKADVEDCVAKIKARMQKLSLPTFLRRSGSSLLEEDSIPKDQLELIVRLNLDSWILRGGTNEFAERFHRDYRKRQGWLAKWHPRIDTA